MQSKIYLVRHAQSQSNVNIKILQEKTNVGVLLTEEGVKQANETGSFLSKELVNSKKIVKIWNSPYERTRQTSQLIKNVLKENNIHFIEEESLYIAERQFGLVDDAIDYKTDHPREFNHYQLHNKEKKAFFARPPLGESPFDMCQRLDFFLRCVIASESEYQHVIVSHGAALRGLIMMHDKRPYETYLDMPNPHNASVHVLDKKNGYQGEAFKPTYVSF